MPNKHVFISYCHDNTDKVEQLRSDLIAGGEQVWWDKDIFVGQNWKQEIRKAMRSSYAVILCFSQESEAKYQSGIYPEVRDAVDLYRTYYPGSSFIFPIRFSSCSIPQLDIDGVSMLEDIQWIDLFPASEWANRVRLLIDALRRAPHHP